MHETTPRILCTFHVRTIPYPSTLLRFTTSALSIRTLSCPTGSTLSVYRYRMKSLQQVPAYQPSKRGWCHVPCFITKACVRISAQRTSDEEMTCV